MILVADEEADSDAVAIISPIQMAIEGAVVSFVPDTCSSVGVVTNTRNGGLIVIFVSLEEGDRFV